jgi:hypothetical protein
MGEAIALRVRNRDPLAAMLLPISPQLRMHAWRSIRGARGGMDGPDPLQQRRVRDRMGGRRSMSPSMVTGLRHAEHARHCRDREDGLIRAHELEDPGVVEVKLLFVGWHSHALSMTCGGHAPTAKRSE